MKKHFGEILGFSLLILFLVALVGIPLYIDHQRDKNLIDTGRTEVACTTEWRDDIKIQDCKTYKVFEHKEK